MARVFDEFDPVYAATCSNVTLCSNWKGFFKNMAEEMVLIAKADDWLKNFEEVEDRKKVSTVLENEKIMEALKEVLSRIQPLHRGKDARVSQERRVAAQAAFKKGDIKMALALASQAVLRAPVAADEEFIGGGISLAMALWVRSEVLLHLDRCSAALEDLKLALKERLPVKMRGLYYWRLGHCYRGTGQPSKAKVSYELACRLIGTDQNAQTQLAKDIDALDYSVQPRTAPVKNGIALTGGAKQNMPALSKLVNIAEEEKKGRFAVAASPINTGDVILVDSPYAACLVSDYYGTHCQHCFKRLEDVEDEAPVWCPKCSGVAFCSVKCRDAAVSSYHTYECQFLDLLIGSGMSVLSHVALRMVTQTGLDRCLDIHSKFVANEIKTLDGTAVNDIEGLSKKYKMRSRKERLNRTKKAMNSVAEKNVKDEIEIKDLTLEETMELKAAQVYSLCTHSEQRKGDDYLKKITMALFLTECLKKSGFFKKCNKDSSSAAEVSICELIVRNLQLLQFNAHEIYETLRSRHQFSGSKVISTAVGIYPTGALFNHECYPAVTRYFEGQKIVLRAIRPLQPGEVVSENYGLNFLIRNLKERQRSLACRYWFRCECIACKEDWPSLKQMRSNTPPYLRCPNVACTEKFRANIQQLPKRCTKCSTPIDEELVKRDVERVDGCVAKYQEGAKLMDKELASEAITILCEAVDLYHEIARPPHNDTHLAQEALRTCFAVAGNVHVIQSSGNAIEGSSEGKSDNK